MPIYKGFPEMVELPEVYLGLYKKFRTRLLICKLTEEQTQKLMCGPAVRLVYIVLVFPFFSCLRGYIFYFTDPRKIIF